MHAARRSPRIVACLAHARVVGHAAFQHPDLLVTDVTVARDDRAGSIANQHGLVAAVGVLPEGLPEDAGPSLDPRDLVDIGIKAEEGPRPKPSPALRERVADAIAEAG